MQAANILLLSAFSGFISVALGAFGAHGLAPVLGERIATWETAVQYQMFHTLVLLALGLLSLSQPVLQGSGLLKVAVWLVVLGIVLFSGSLYLLSLTGYTRLGMIAPLGGLSLLGGWLVLGWLAISELKL